MNKMCSFGDSFVAAKIEVIEFVHIFTITNLLIEAEALSEESPICSQVAMCNRCRKTWSNKCKLVLRPREKSVRKKGSEKLKPTRTQIFYYLIML